MLWPHWSHIVWQLRPAFKDIRSFHWFIIISASFMVRNDFEGVTGLIRAGFIFPGFYQSVLDFFCRSIVSPQVLAMMWTKICMRIFSPFIKKINSRIILLGDGLIKSKEGKKMPGVKSLHQNSENNSKPEYVMGHYIQLISLVVGTTATFFAVPLAGFIHLGFKRSPNERKTVFTKMLEMINSLQIENKFYFVGDAYYSCQGMVKGLLEMGSHIITRVKHNAVAWEIPPKEKYGSGKSGKVGRPSKYGEKIKLFSLFKTLNFETDFLSFYGQECVELKYAVKNLIWRPLGIPVNFVFVISPKGKTILMTTDLSLNPLEVLKAYELRFKIEVSIKAAIHRFGTFCYHFWLKSMAPIKRKSSGQYLHKASVEFKAEFFRKIDAYHLFIQIGLIAQGMAQYLALRFPQEIGKSCMGNGWLRTRNKSLIPSENLVRKHLQDERLEFLLIKQKDFDYQKFLTKIRGFQKPHLRAG